MPLSDDRWVEIDAVFAGALELPAERRRTFVDTATTDPVLRAAVVALLASLEEAERHIGESASVLVGDAAPGGALASGARVGPYEVLREIGRGGMGEVYLARRADVAYEREVAIKLVRDDVADSARVRRFAAEQRILAGLEHPNIARLYDSGTAADGRPYLVMEYVAGTRIDRYADEHRLDLRRRLELFVAVCDAVSYAHQRLVVHRDLKPANVLVGEAGDVKLLDFGIAKLLASDPPEGAETRRGHRVLTPEYAAPEQVRAEPVAAGVDVYALGVILHELLTGRRPAWQRLVLAQADSSEIEAAMAAPSAAVTRSSGEGPSVGDVARGRGTTPDRLRRALRGDLDTIVLTALAPDPGRRYASVQSLRDDVRRTLDGLPLSVRPASIGYRLAKFTRRNRALVTVSVLGLGLVLVYTAALAVQSRRVTAERDRAELERARAGEVVQLLTGLFASSDPFAPGRPDTLRVTDILAAGAERVERELAGQPAVAAELLTVLGRVYSQIGRVQNAVPMLERAVSLRRGTPGVTGLELAASLTELGLARLRESRAPDAEALFREALALRETASEASGAVISASLANIATALQDQGSLDTAAALYERALLIERSRAPLDSARLADLLNNRANVAQRAGDPATAEAMIREAIALNRSRLGADHPRVLADMGNLGFLVDRMGRSEEAVPILREALTGVRARLAPDHPLTVSITLNLGGALGRTGALAEAVTMLEQAVAGDRRTMGGRHAGLAISLDNLASAYERTGRFAEMDAAYREAYDLNFELLGPTHPATAIVRGRRAAAECRAGLPRARQLASLDEARAAIVALEARFPEGHPQRLSARIALGACLGRVGQVEVAEAELERQLEDARRGLSPGHPVLRAAVHALLDVHARAGSEAKRARIQAIADTLLGAAK